jgi:hypothetical protein
MILDNAFKILYKNNTMNVIFGLENSNSSKIQVQDLLIIKCLEEVLSPSLNEKNENLKMKY